MNENELTDLERDLLESMRDFTRQLDEGEITLKTVVYNQEKFEELKARIRKV